MNTRKRRPNNHPPAPSARGARPPDDDAASSLWWTFLAYFALLALVLVTYIPAFDAGFIIDDDANITANPTIHAWPGLWQMWTDPTSVQQYYPMVHTMFWVEHKLWGFHPAGYHIVNVLLHAANTLLIWRLLVRLRVPGAWLTAAIFAVHPVEVESVAWAVERKNVLSLALALLSMRCYLRFAPPATNDTRAAAGHWRWYLISLAVFAAALFAKTAVVAMPPVLLVIYWWKRGRITARDVGLLLPFFALAVALGCVTVWLEHYHVGARGDEWKFTPTERVLVAGRALWFDAGKLAWPYPTVFFYPRFSLDERAWWPYLFPLSAVTVFLVLWLTTERLGRGPLAALMIYAGMVAPTLGFINVYFHRFSFVADHFQYHASPALIALAVAAVTPITAWGTIWRSGGGSLLWPWLPFGRCAAAMLLVTLATLSFRAVSLYHDEETLYRDVIAKDPKSWIARSNLAVCLSDKAQFDEAIKLLQEALQLEPSKPRVDFNYGKVVIDRGERRGFKAGELEDAMAHFREAARLTRDWAPPYIGIGVVMLHLRRFDDAIKNLDRAIEIDPTAVDALVGMGAVRAERGELTRAVAYYDQALRVAPNRPDVHYGLGMVASANNQVQLAAQHFSEAVRLRPDYAQAWNNLGATLARLQDVDGAIECFREVARLDPGSGGATDNLAKALEMKRALEAKRE